jgi:hypothetical protein
MARHSGAVTGKTGHHPDPGVKTPGNTQNEKEFLDQSG